MMTISADHSLRFDSGTKEKRAAAMASVFAAFGLLAVKLVVGLLSGSLGILAEAAHSGLDLVAALVTYLAVRLSDRPADESHPYGHGKIENFSALVETGLLFVTCAWIVYEAVRRLFFHEVEITPSLWAFLVIAVSIVVDVNRSRMLSRVARKHRSQALEADALHFSTDIWSSSVVLVGLGCVWLGRHVFPRQSGILNKADAVAALGVAFIVLFVSYRLGKRTVDVLLDRAPEGVRETIEKAVREIEGVLGVGKIRVRRSGARTFVDLAVEVDRTLSFERAHDIAVLIETRILEIVPGADVVVHTDPSVSDRETIARRIRVLADRDQIPVHNISVHEDRGEICVDLHLEVDERLLLGEAHDLADRVERQLMKEIPRIRRVNTHIESRGTGVDKGEDVTGAEPGMAEAVRTIADGIAGAGCCHDVVVRRQGESYAVSLHCGFERNMPIAEAHAISTDIEEAVKSGVPGVAKVLVHTEPKIRRDS
jgi:cation diffusion facilitator family transporter